MRRSKALAAASVAALAAGSLAASGVFGSSHREAPRIMLDPAADNTDVYAFTAKDAPGSLTVVANWIPFEDPAGGPYFGKLDPKARYYVKIDNTGDGREDVAYRWDFKNKFRRPDSFLYAAPDGHDGRRSGRQLRPDVRPLPRDVRQGRRARAHEAGRRRPGGGAGQRRPEDDPELRGGLERRDRPGQGRRQDVRRPGRRRVLHRPRHGLRRHQHRQAGPPEHRPRQPGRRQGRRRLLQHALVRPAGPGVAR